MTSEEYHSLTASIASKTDPSSAARALTKQAEEGFSTEPDIEGDLRRVWGSIIKVAADTEHQSQGPLVAIVRAVQEKKFAEGDGSSELTVWDNKVEVWNDMPLFGSCIREAWNKAPGTSPHDEFSAGQWCNINAFLARLTSLSQSVHAFDFSLFGLWTLRSALESPDEASPAELDAGKAWFTYAEDVIRKFSDERKSFPNKVAMGGVSFADKEWTGFNPQRLEIWQAALRQSREEEQN